MLGLQSSFDFWVMHGGNEEESEEDEEEEDEEEEEEEESTEPPAESPAVSKKPGQCFFNTHLHNQCASWLVATEPFVDLSSNRKQ